MASRLTMQVTNEAHPYFRRCKPVMINDDPLMIPDKGDGNGYPAAVASEYDLFTGSRSLWIFRRGGVFGAWFNDLGFLSTADMLALITTAIFPKLGDLGELGVSIEAGYSGEEYLLNYDVPSVGTLDANTGLYTVSFAGETIAVSSNQDIEPSARGIVDREIADLGRTTWADILNKQVIAQTSLANRDYGRVHLFKHGWGWFDGALCSPTATSPQNTEAAARVAANPSHYSYRLIQPSDF